ncbi:MAG: WG repeat-containing protein, partial [Clostridia bacterium]|nr:WG repeat-containing protein [Clostridia bacterium]
MKRFLTFLLLFAICLSTVLLFSSCGKKKGSGKEYNLFSEEGLLLVERNDKYGFIDKTGKEVIPCKYYNASSFSNGYAAVQEKKDDSYYYIKPDGTRLLETPFYRAGSFDSQGRAIVKKSETGKCDLIDSTGKTIFSAEDLFSGDNGCYLFMDDSDLYGIVDKNGEIALAAMYDDLSMIYNVESFSFDSASALTDRFLAYRKQSSGTVCYIINLEGDELYVADKNCEVYSVCISDVFVAECKEGLVLINRSGEEIQRFDADDFEMFFSSGFLFLGGIEYERYCELVDLKGNVVFNSEKSNYELEDYANWNGDFLVYDEAKNSDNYCGIMDGKTGEIIIPCDYYDLTVFDENGLCIGQKEKNGDFIALNRKGETVFSISCDDLCAFDNNNAP